MPVNGLDPDAYRSCLYRSNKCLMSKLKLCLASIVNATKLSLKLVEVSYMDSFPSILSPSLTRLDFLYHHVFVFGCVRAHTCYASIPLSLNILIDNSNQILNSVGTETSQHLCR